jgi:RNA polymerase sigma factor (sigma-70 family)
VHVPAPAGSDSSLSPDGRRILAAIESLPEGEREAFDLVKIQGMTYAEAGQVLGISIRTVKRWVSGSLRLLTARLGDLDPGDTGSGPA